ncbi:hypothetical protein K488DRAFT_82813 [Vararia minispora EC-137]|uniref:Uncharacterized protein n=1 Tax=Vararia minispora EC-137 TaxID=1314806 RepID=A0ACB8QVB3_9AGAM|nr:hypothetical protein K488DRAFT_82813 [Vararia minispora EC-137]
MTTYSEFPSPSSSTTATLPPAPVTSNVDYSTPALVHRQKDFRVFTFQQSLLHLGQLAEDVSFADSIKSMKEEQDGLEQKLWEERQEIIHRHERKVEAVKAKAQIVGVGLSKHDAETLSTAVRRELHQFDLERVLPAWDGLTSKHQAAMEVLTVPSMFVTSDTSSLQKQKKVMQVLESVVSIEG